MNLLKTAILIPVKDVQPFWDSTAAHLYRLRTQPDVYVFTENDSSDNTINMINRFKRYNIILHPTIIKQKGMYSDIAQVRQIMLEWARENNVDYAIFLDADIFIKSTNFIDIITSYSTDITGGCYYRAYPFGTMLAAVWPGRKSTDRGPNTFDYSVAPKDRPLDTTVLAVGGGCMCLNNRVINDKRLNFYPLKDEKDAEDYTFCIQAKKLGYRIGLESTIPLEHWYNSNYQRKKKWFATPEEAKKIAEYGLY